MPLVKKLYCNPTLVDNNIKKKVQFELLIKSQLDDLAKYINKTFTDN